ncbi:19S proteasome regulatory subunit Rpn7 [Schizosaccharomyces cryophilus OY26]|uniref:19S proteasome regulatory subunit Rpn7 n=1 Tax=Schizosaccharomyces cryophilus (strain OY26 / ATCC MYA-4695 / CBS 11777 / NBRC 106824 / NRRL Y48691) TaxID=653667 RepID=S9VZ45_SCHCR|nr:19S proteasome regulatory subunit Rpn7 [Schizosaccharomyces cryophilus OY26]EPY51090.1 19S proteasome regulatory subunit Rpn7 [Schizosaccharomyces cryophilus OY26]
MSEKARVISDLTISQSIYELSNGFLERKHEKALETLFSAIRENHLAPLYQYVCEYEGTMSKIDHDEAFYNQMMEENNKRIEEYDKALADAQELNGEHEILEAMRNKAYYFVDICDRVRGVQLCDEIYDRATLTGMKIDVLFLKIRLAYIYADMMTVSHLLEKMKPLIEKGGDWERKNRLKAYQGIYLMSIRDFSGAADLLLDCMSTFSSTELLPYYDIVRYAVISGAISLDRVHVKSKIIDSPEVLAVLPRNESMASLEACINSLYLCDYAGFFRTLADVEQNHLKCDQFLVAHYRYYVREMRRRAYSQLLESYRALSIDSMAAAFGVSVEYIDRDVASFIPDNKLNCVIDRVHGVVETNRPDEKNRQYQEVVKQGDVLLNKLQKYQATVMRGAFKV